MRKEFIASLDLSVFDEVSAEGAEVATGAENQSQQVTAAETGDNNTQAAAEPSAEKAEKEPTFDELIKGKYKEPYQKAVQKIINGKFKESKLAQARIDKAMPIFDVLADKFGIKDTSDIDAVLDSIAEKIQSDTTLYEQEALDKGVPLEEYARGKQRELENKMLRRELDTLKHAAQEQQDKKIVEGWQKQAEALKDVYPELDLAKELGNRNFTDLLKLNYDVKTAYEIVYRDELAQGAIQQAVEQTQKKTVDDIRARGMRPRENGLSSNGVANVKKKTVSEMSNNEILKMAEKIMRGEKVDI